jgi:hypothetical protein
MLTRTGRAALRAVWPGLGLVVVGLYLAEFAFSADRPKEEVRAGELRLSGPYRHDNLTVFLIHGPDQFSTAKLLTLAEAVEQNRAVVHETGVATELQVENLSDQELFVPSGEVVKGGKQDRLITYDLLLPPKSGKVTVVCSSVEQGRWESRGRESADRFSTASAPAPSKNLKLAGSVSTVGGFPGGFPGGGGSPPIAVFTSCSGIPFGGFNLNGFQNGGFNNGGFNNGFQGLNVGGFRSGQGGVWVEVTVLQAKLSSRTGTEVRARESPSSLPLTLEHPKVQAAVKGYTDKLAGAPADARDVIGYAFAVNGEIYSAEVYAGNDLFRKLWPRLLKANAVEALAEAEVEAPFQLAGAEEVQQLLLGTEKVDPVEKSATPRVRVLQRETGTTLLLETRDREHQDRWVHKVYLTK